MIALAAIRATLSRIPSWAWIIGAFVLLLALLVFLILRSTDQRVRQAETTAVTVDRQEANIEALAKDVAARGVVAEKQVMREEKLDVEEKELRDEAAKGNANPVGPGQLAIIERVRQQQAADRRASGAR